MKKNYLAILAVLVTLVFACTVTKNDGLDKNAKIFLTQFQNTLSKTDDDILSLFKSTQSKEEILKGIAVLQNKDTTFVKTVLVYDDAKAVWEEGYLNVSIPVQIIGKGAEPENNTLTLSLFQKKDGKFYINKLGGQEVYTAYYSIKSKIENADELARRLADVKIYYDRARELQKDYDTVVWYVHHNDTAYYYAVNGTYIYDSLNGKSPATFKMGLLHTSGRVIVPVEFDLVGNPGINLPNAVEVKKDGKIGYYGIDGKQLVPVDYTWLVPYEEGEAKALVKKDTLFGWLDKGYQYHENFPTPKAEKYIKDFEYLTEKKFVFGREHQELIQVVTIDEVALFGATGIIVYPTFLVQNQIFKSVNNHFLTLSDVKNETFEYGNEYEENDNESQVSISDRVKVFISNFKTKFIGGRGEFYTVHRINIIDNALNIISSTETTGDSNFEFKKHGENLFEAKFMTDPYFRRYNLIERNLPDYNYFSFDGSNILALESNRRFKFTQFVKLDSSYLSGTFSTYDIETDVSGESKFLSGGTLKLMRNEILASYGYIFNDPTIAEDDANLDWRSWYKPTTSSYDEVYSKASEIDKYNLDFLAKILGPVKKPI
jgi:hypothetical protein